MASWSCFLGWVKATDPARGCSWLTCPGSGHERDIYVHSSTASPRTLAVDDTVACDVEVDTWGRPQAVAPLWKLAGWNGKGDPNQYGEFQGVISAVLANGNGFVECPEVTATHGYDAFIHDSVMRLCELVAGDAIAFNLHISSFGKPQVSAPVWKSLTPGWTPVSTSSLASEPRATNTGGSSASGPQIVSPASRQSRGEMPSVASTMPTRSGPILPVWAEKAQAKAISPVWATKAQAWEGEQTQPWGSEQTAVPGGSFMGSVKKVDVAKGFSMVACPGSGFERDVYVRKKVADPELLRPDDIVAFDIHVTLRGLPQASAPLWKLLGWNGQGEPSHLGDFHGYVYSVLPSGCGFVKSPEVTKAHGMDAYIHAKVMAMCELASGDLIAFSLRVGPSGKPQVSAPVWKCCSDRELLPPEPEELVAAGPITPVVPTSVRSSKPGKGWAWSTGGVEESWVVEMAAEQKDLYTGSVKTVHLARGFCIIVCPDSGFSCDVYLHKTVADPQMLAINDVVAFKISVNARGMPQAAAPVWKLVGWSGSDVPTQFGEHLGYVKTVLPNGSGFVECPAVAAVHGYDAYVPEKVMKFCQLGPGDTIAFNAHIGSAGRPQVSAPCWKCCSQDGAAQPSGHGTAPQQAVQAATPHAPALGGCEGEEPHWGAEDAASAAIYMGTVKAASVGKGFSVISCQDTGLGSDVFVHKSVASPQLLSANDIVAFQIAAGSPGMPQACPPLWKLVGWNGNDPPKLGEYVGHVKRVLPNGSAFVDCREVTTAHGCETYIHETVMSFCGLCMGDTIAFNVHVNASGRPQMSTPCWKCCTEGSAEPPADPASQRHYPLSPGPLPVGPVLPGSASQLLAFSSQAEVEAEIGTAGSGSVEGEEQIGHEGRESDEGLRGPEGQGGEDGPGGHEGLGRQEVPSDQVVPSSERGPGAEEVREALAVFVASGAVGAGEDVAANKVGTNGAGGEAREPSGGGEGTRSGNGDEIGDGCQGGATEGDAAVECGGDAGEECGGDAGEECRSDAGEGECGAESPEGEDPLAFREGIGNMRSPDTLEAIESEVGAVEVGEAGAKADEADAALARAGHHEVGQQETGGKDVAEADLTIPDEGRADTRAQASAAELAEGVLDIRLGTVKVADEVGGFSTVTCLNPGFDTDVHVHNSVADPEVLAPDDVVAFKLHVNASGAPEAAAPFWKLMGWDGQVKPKSFGEYHGRICRVLPNGNGLVVCPAVSSTYGTQASVHESVMGLCALTSGDAIAFGLHVSASGEPQVVTPLWRCCTAPYVDCDEPGLVADTQEPRQALVDPRSPAVCESAGELRRPPPELGHKRKVLPRPVAVPAGVQDSLDGEAVKPREAQEHGEPRVKRARVEMPGR